MYLSKMDYGKYLEEAPHFCFYYHNPKTFFSYTCLFRDTIIFLVIHNEISFVKSNFKYEANVHLVSPLSKIIRLFFIYLKAIEYWSRV